MPKEDNANRILVNIYNKHHGGHNKDIEYVLKSTKRPKQFRICNDKQISPDSFLQITLERILTTDVVLLDAIMDKEGTFKDRLIQFGIAFALEKQRYFFYVKENSGKDEKIKSNYVDQYIIEASGYYSFIEFLNEKVDALSTQAQIKPRKPMDITHEAFSVIGANELTDPDLVKIIRELAAEIQWHVTFYKPPSGANIHEELSQQTVARTFSLFCINKSTELSVYISIGLALGFGVPLLIIIEEDAELPQILSGYAGVLSYTNTNKTELTKKLTECANIFFSPEIFKTWDGFTYFYLLSKMEKKLIEVSSKSGIEEVEKVILAVTKVGRAPIVLSYILLGDVYRRKNQIIDPLNTEFLKEAISWYEKALKIQENNTRCVDGIDATKKLIQLIDLVKDKNYESIPELVFLIGNGINSEQYQYLRSFLISEVKKLLKNEEYLPAIALLAAMQKHDKSDDLSKLWEDVNPKKFLESIQKYQENELKMKAELNNALEKNKDIDNQLSNAYKEVAQANQLKTKLEGTTKYYGENIFVNFGRGWATYTPIKGLPYIERDGQTIKAKEGMGIVSGDTVYDEDGNVQFHWLSKEESLALAYYRNADS